MVDEKLDHFFNNLNCPVKVNLAFGFILKIVEDGGFRYFYAHENNTLLDRSKLVRTVHELTKQKDFANKTDVIESCGGDRTNTKWSFFKEKQNKQYLLFHTKTYLWVATTLFQPNI